MVEKQVVTPGFNNENPRSLITPSIQQLCDQPNKATTKKYKGTNHIQYNKVIKINVKGALGLVRRITLIHHKSQPLTLTLTNHVPIVVHMGMIMIITSHFTQSYNMANHIIPMLTRVRVLKQVQKGKVIWLTKN